MFKAMFLKQAPELVAVRLCLADETVWGWRAPVGVFAPGLENVVEEAGTDPVLLDEQPGYHHSYKDLEDFLDDTHKFFARHHDDVILLDSNEYEVLITVVAREVALIAARGHEAAYKLLQKFSTRHRDCRVRAICTLQLAHVNLLGLSEVLHALSDGRENWWKARGNRRRDAPVPNKEAALHILRLPLWRRAAAAPGGATLAAPVLAALRDKRRRVRRAAQITAEALGIAGPASPVLAARPTAPTPAA